MSELQDLYKKLEEYSDFNQDDNCEKFLYTVDEIILKQCPDSIPILLKYFNDNSEYSWVLENLSLALETYNTEDYVTKFLNNLINLDNTNIRWFKSILYTILNSSEEHRFLRNNIYLASRLHLLKLFYNIEEESPCHREAIKALKQELG